jgi:hypothetical protein
MASTATQNLGKFTQAVNLRHGVVIDVRKAKGSECIRTLCRKAFRHMSEIHADFGQTQPALSN